MNLNPAHYFIKRYHSPDLKPNELKRMLNLWFPFLMNRIQIISINEDFHEIQVCLKHSFWNRNPNKSAWGGSITSVIDPFFPVMMKQIVLRKGIHTEFYSKAVHVEFLQKVESHLYFHIKIDNIEVKEALENLEKNGKYENWHSADGVDNKGNVCVKGRVQVYLRKR